MSGFTIPVLYIYSIMKENLNTQIKDILTQGKTWVKLEIEYAKLTLAEKLTMLISALIIGAVCLLLGIVVLLMLAFALVEVFKTFMHPGLAYLSVGGIVCVFIILFYLLRKPILLNPIARLITRLFIEKH